MKDISARDARKLGHCTLNKRGAPQALRPKNMSSGSDQSHNNSDYSDFSPSSTASSDAQDAPSQGAQLPTIELQPPRKPKVFHRKMWRKCVKCRILFNHNPRVADETETELASSSAREAPVASGICPVCTPAPVEAAPQPLPEPVHVAPLLPLMQRFVIVNP